MGYLIESWKISTVIQTGGSTLTIQTLARLVDNSNCTLWRQQLVCVQIDQCNFMHVDGLRVQAVVRTVLL